MSLRANVVNSYITMFDLCAPSIALVRLLARARVRARARGCGCDVTVLCVCVCVCVCVVCV